MVIFLPPTQDGMDYKSILQSYQINANYESIQHAMMLLFYKNEEKDLLAMSLKKIFGNLPDTDNSL